MKDDLYPNSPGFQSHSETSAAGAEAVEANGTKVRLYDYIIDALTLRGERGATNNELAILARKTIRKGIQNGTMGARLCELELQGRIVKTTTKRENPDTGVEAFVYVIAPIGTYTTQPPKVRRSKRDMAAAWKTLEQAVGDTGDMFAIKAAREFKAFLA